MPFIIKDTITETFLERVRTTPKIIGFQFKPTESAKWKKVTYQEFYDECRQVSLGLMELGLRPGDKAVILSNTRYEWSLCDMAILGAKAVTVPIYASNTPDDVAYIINHCEARIAVLEDTKQLQKIFEKRLADPQCLPKLEKIIVIDPAAMNLVARHMTGIEVGSKDVLTLEALKTLGANRQTRSPSQFDDHLKSAKPDDILTICYTSGTTGIPKGVIITQDNMMSVLKDCVTALGREIKPEREVLLSFLPFSHILGKVESMSVYVFGFQEAFAENIDKLMTNISEIRPTILFSVPRTFEKAYTRIRAHFEAAPATQRKLIHWALDVGARYYRAILENRKPTLKEATEYSMAKALVFRTIAQRFGGRLKFTICGGAPLPKEIGEFFQIIGIEILEGYGLTETCAPISLNPPHHLRFGTVGKPLSDVTLKIAEDGEILVKSRKVFQGYFKMPEETKEALENGWLHTGDIGHIEQDGYLRITDRKKDLIVTSGGKNIAPQKIENLAKSQKMISQFVVHGDRRHFLTALITLDHEQAIRYASENQILFSEYAELVKNQKMISLIQRIVDDINRHLAPYETIKRFVILPHDFTIESGELTPSLKVRRSLINKRYKEILDSMYT